MKAQPSLGGAAPTCTRNEAGLRGSKENAPHTRHPAIGGVVSYVRLSEGLARCFERRCAGTGLPSQNGKSRKRFYWRGCAGATGVAGGVLGTGARMP
jgi:hypothetical protein